MTLAKIIDTIKMIALKHPNVNSAYEGNIYDILNAKPDNRYASVVITQQSHTTDEIYDHYGFVIFYVDRLVDNLEENRVQIQSIGKSMLGNIITAFCNEFEAECDNISYQTFTQRFADETAGVYCTITIDTVKDVYCAERYWDESWSAPVVSIKNVDMSITITDNGHYVLEYDPTIYTGIDKVDIDVNVDVDSYYNRGYGVGYDQGKVDGVSEQKSKLETINITENGVYSNEDGYNHIEVNVPDLNGSYEEGYNQGYAEGEQASYNTGYEQGQIDIAANARVLKVTKNGIYTSKFTQNSDYDFKEAQTGFDFYSYANLNGVVYDTNIPATMDSRVELWYKGDNQISGDGYNAIIGAGESDNSNVFEVIYWQRNNDDVFAQIGLSKINTSWDESIWHHIILSVADGFVIDGEKRGDIQSNSTTPNGNFLINGIGHAISKQRNANGSFGMVKIDDTVIIPTADGFLNTNTGEYLSKVKDGGYDFVEINKPIAEGELYKTINVNIAPKVKIAESDVKFGQSIFKEVPEWADFDGITSLSNMFTNCTNLQTIPLIDTSKVTNMTYMFNGCSNLRTISQIDTSNVKDMSNMFNTCSKLQTIPQIDTSNVTNMSYMFYVYAGNKNLVSLPKFECGKVENISRYFSYSADSMTSLTDVGGWNNLKIDWNDNYGLRNCPNLTYQSCINILNGLYDFVGNGESTTRTLKVHSNFLTTVGDEISIGTAKGWTITA